MLKRHGVTASLTLPPDFNDRFQKGDYVGSIYGHGGSIREPYDTLRLYQGKSIAVPGAHLVNFSRWKNPDFDKIVDEVYVTDPQDIAKPEGVVPRRDGNLAAGPAGHPTGAEPSPHPDEHHLLEELADRGQRLHQRRFLAPDLPARAVEPRSRRDAPCNCSISPDASASSCSSSGWRRRSTSSCRNCPARTRCAPSCWSRPRSAATCTPASRTW